MLVKNLIKKLKELEQNKHIFIGDEVAGFLNFEIIKLKDFTDKEALEEYNDEYGAFINMNSYLIYAKSSI